jgi:hypothetical protein
VSQVSPLKLGLGQRPSVRIRTPFSGIERSFSAFLPQTSQIKALAEGFSSFDLEDKML